MHMLICLIEKKANKELMKQYRKQKKNSEKLMFLEIRDDNHERLKEPTACPAREMKKCLH